MSRLARACAAAVVAALVVAGCGDDDGGTGATSTSSTSTTSPGTSGTSTTLAPDETARRAATDEVLALFPEAPGAASAEELAQAVAAALGEQGEGDGDGALEVEVVSVEGDDPAVAVIAVDGFADDAVAGATYVVTMVDDGGTWRIDGAERSDRCARDVSDDGRLCV